MTLTLTRRESDPATLFGAVVQLTALMPRACLFPWVVTVNYREPVAYHDGASLISYEGRYETAIHVVEASINDAPFAEDYVPEGASFCKADILCATAFDDMRRKLRERYRPQYEAYLRWRKTKAYGIAPAANDPYIASLAQSWLERGQ